MEEVDKGIGGTERMDKLGKHISERRKAINMTQQQLADIVGVTAQAVSLWERGEYEPDIAKLKATAKALDISISDLIDGEHSDQKQWSLRDRFFSEEHMYTFVKSAAVHSKFTQTAKALPYVKKLHLGQYRVGNGNVPYISHPLMMACHALAMGIADDDLLAIILLHDVCEDCDVRPEELPFNDVIKEAVEAITHIKDESNSRDQDLKKYYGKIKKNKYASIAKAIDRCNNVSLMATGFSPDKMQEYILETEEYVFPILDNVKHKYPEYYNAAFLIKYQMISLLESLKRVL